MSRSLFRFSTSMVVSIGVTVFVLALLVSANIVTAYIPVVGVGGLYAAGNEVTGNTATIYPEYTTTTSGVLPVTDSPADECEFMPLLAFNLETARVNGTSFRKDIELPFLTDRFMSINVTQPKSAGGDPAFMKAEQLTIFITQLRAQRMVMRNIEMREAGPNGNQNAAGDPKWGNKSGEVWIRGGNVTGTQIPSDSNFPGYTEAGTIVFDLEMWVHGMQGEVVSFESGDQASAVDIDLEFPTEGELDKWYEGKLGYDLPEYPNYQNEQWPNQDTDREQYFKCTPTDR